MPCPASPSAGAGSGSAPGARHRAARQPLHAGRRGRAAATVDAGLGAGVALRSTPRRTTALGLSPSAASARRCRAPARPVRAVAPRSGRLVAPARPGRDGATPRASRRTPTAKRVWDFSARRRATVARGEPGAARARPGRHGPASTTPTTTSARPAEQAFPALAELRDQGVVGAIGAGMNQAEMLTRFVRELDLDLVLVAGRYTLLDQRGPGRAAAGLRRARGAAVVIGGVFNSGLLADPRPGATFDYAPAAAAAGRAGAAARRRSAPGTACRCGRRRWPSRCGHPAVASVLVGARTAAEVAGRRGLLAPAGPRRALGRAGRRRPAARPAPPAPREPGRRPPPPLGPGRAGPTRGWTSALAPIRRPFGARGPGRGRWAARGRARRSRPGRRQRRGDRGAPGRGRRRRDRVAGVVGWVDLDRARRGRRRSPRCGRAPGGEALVGIRHQVHDEPDPDWLLRDQRSRGGLAAVAAAGLAYDLLVRERELPAPPGPWPSGFPSSRFVARPPGASRGSARRPVRAVGRPSCAALARLPNVACKVSGLVTEADWDAWTPEQLVRYVRRRGRRVRPRAAAVRLRLAGVPAGGRLRRGGRGGRARRWRRVGPRARPSATWCSAPTPGGCTACRPSAIAPPTPRR